MTSRTNSYGLIRFVLATAVVYTHSYYLVGASKWDPFQMIGLSQLDLGSLAVATFFALSGMLVTPSYARTGDIRIYSWHRILRIYPALICSLLITVGILIPLTSSLSVADLALGSDYLKTSVVYLASNLAVPNSVPRFTGHFVGNSVTDFTNGSMWTLRYEIAGYALIALIGLLGGLTRFKMVSWIGFLICCAIGARDAMHLEASKLWFFTSSGKKMILIAIGGMVWASFSTETQRRINRPIALLGLGAICLASLYTDFWWIGFAVTIPPLLHFLAYALPFDWWEKQVGGDYSYGLYIFHYPVQQTFVHLNLATTTPWVFSLITFVVALILAMLSWKFIERPALQLKSWRPNWKKTA